MKALLILTAAAILLIANVAIAADAAPVPTSQPAEAIAKAPPVVPTMKAPVAKPATKPAPAVAEQVGMLVQLFKDKQWRPAVALLITLIIFFWRRFLGKLLIDKIPVKHLGWFTALLGVLAAVPAALGQANFVWYKFATDVLLISGPAVLFWTTVGKHVLPKVFGAVPEKAK